jgi:MraZ protein
LFRGINAINIDPKGRMAIPTRYRAQLENNCQGRLVLTIDTDERCLLLYEMAEWEVIEQKIAALPSFNKAARRVQRLLIGYATETELDSNGRILLPTLLREYAGLSKRVMMIGQGKKFELWDDEQWNARRENWLKEDAEGGEALPVEMQALSL